MDENLKYDEQNIQIMTVNQLKTLLKLLKEAEIQEFNSNIRIEKNERTYFIKKE